MKKDLHYLAFTSDWFQKHQRILLFVFNLVYKFFPSLFFKSGERDDFKGNKIIEVGTSFATCDAGLQFFKKSALLKTAWENLSETRLTRRLAKKEYIKILRGKKPDENKLLPARKTVFFTDWNYSKMLYNAFKPMWWAMHYWDEFFADKWLPRLAFGFSTLTVYSTPGTTVSGYVGRELVDETWATIIAGEGTHFSANVDGALNLYSTTTDNQWNIMRRIIVLFNTSALGASATISAAVLSLFGTAKADNGTAITPNIDIYTSTPASNTALVAADYTQVGSISQTGSPITYANWSITAYNDFTFNATGIGNISKTSISKFGARNQNYDVAATAPTWSSQSSHYLLMYFGGATGTANDPKLVVTYTVPAQAGFLYLMV